VFTVYRTGKDKSMDSRTKLMRCLPFRLISLILVLVFPFIVRSETSAALTESPVTSGQAVNVSVPLHLQNMNALSDNPPTDPVKLIFIHHSVGDNWFSNWSGSLGDTLGANNYYVSDTFYGWGPDVIGDKTDIGHWWLWFRGDDSSTYVNALYNTTAQHASYTRPMADPGGENEIIMFKSCWPNSELKGQPDEPPTVGENPLRGQPAWTQYHTVGNAKGIYNDILEYFETRQNKLFIAITAPPVDDITYGENARAFNNWLVNDWLADYPYDNVAVFDFFNVLTTNGGDPDTNDFGLATGNHHRLVSTTSPMSIEHITDGDDDGSPNTMEYPRINNGSVDLHPTSAGTQKATGEFVPLLNAYYNCWKYGQCVDEVTDEIILTVINADESIELGEAATYNLTVTANEGFSEEVMLMLQDAPGGTSHSFVPDSGIPPFTSDLVISTTSSTPFSMYVITATAIGGGVEDSIDITLSVNPVNDPPVANEDSATTVEDVAVRIDVAVNDSDPDGNLDVTTANAICTGCSIPLNGGLANNGDGSFTYTPVLGFIGPDSFVYEICDSAGVCDAAVVNITVNPDNDAPVVEDDSVTTEEDVAVMIDVTANDSDPDGNLDVTTANTTCAGCGEPINGSLVNNGDGTFEYTPNRDFNGADSYEYEVCDDLGVCVTAVVNITVSPVNDPPVANNDSATTDEDVEVVIDVATNDSDPDGNLDVTTANTFCIGCSVPVNGNLVNNGDGTFEYTPNQDFNGSDSYVYEVCDDLGVCDTAVVNIPVSPVNDAPVANADMATTDEDMVVLIDVAANDSDPDGNLDPTTANTACVECTEPVYGNLINNGDGTFKYIPTLGFSGSDRYFYGICDSLGVCDTAVVNIIVNSVNDAPVANDDAANTEEDVAVTIDVTVNDNDPDGNLDPTTVNTTCAECAEPIYGKLVNNGDGTFEYIRTPGFEGSDSFVYEICDTINACDTAVVIVTVNPIDNDLSHNFYLAVILYRNP
jgi:hypothetical protein